MATIMLFRARLGAGPYPGQFDPGFRFIQLLQALGLAWNVKLPSNLPPRRGIKPLTSKKHSGAASKDQARLFLEEE